MNQRISEKTWFIVLMLIVIFPIGLYCMWKNKKFSLKTRKVVTGIIAILCIISLIPTNKEPESTPVAKTTPVVETKPIPETTPVVEATPTPETSPVAETAPTPETPPVAETSPEQPPADKDIDYTIEQVDDASFGNIIRKDLNIVVSNSEDITRSDFESLCKKITKEFISTTDVNALTLYFYNNASEIGKGYTVGMCTYYPGGSIGNASDVKSGDYSTFQYNYTFN